MACFISLSISRYFKTVIIAIVLTFFNIIIEIVNKIGGKEAEEN